MEHSRQPCLFSEGRVINMFFWVINYVELAWKSKPKRDFTLTLALTDRTRLNADGITTYIIIITIIIVSLPGRHSTGDQQCLTYNIQWIKIK